MIVTICHDEDCPLGINGTLAYFEARDAMSHSHDPDVYGDMSDDERADLSVAEHELDEKHRCTCGCNDLLKDSETKDGVLYLTIAGMDKLAEFVRLKP